MTIAEAKKILGKECIGITSDAENVAEIRERAVAEMEEYANGNNPLDQSQRTRLHRFITLTA